MAFIALACIITPRIAKLIIKRHPNLADKPENSEQNNSSEEPKVQGPYDPQKDKYDLNYKIYNEDIYGVDFKHVKEKFKRKNG
ncbi:MAG: hypothetical protein ACI4RN_06860 [Oscillospiraceae bacterium]